MTHQMDNKQKNKLPHTFQIAKCSISNDFDMTKNPKLVPNWKGPGEIIDINDTNAKIKLKIKLRCSTWLN